MNIDQSAMSYTSIDSSRQALQTNGKLFPNSEFLFELLEENKNIQKDSEEETILIKILLFFKIIVVYFI